MLNQSQSALNAYKEVGLQGATTDADPHALITMLLDGARERVISARRALEEKDIAKKGECIGKAVSIIDGLKLSLNRDANSSLADNLASLYDYMIERLTQANLRNDAAILTEVLGLLGEIKSAWDEIPSRLANERVSG
jgi:flagellar protein FliS